MILRKSPKDLGLVFIDTAAEVEKGDLQWLKEDRKALVKAGFNVSDFTISGKSEKDIRSRLDNIDIIYFSGGNQFYLLEKIQESSCSQLIYNYIKNGKVYIGCSAGSIIAGPDIYITRFIDEISNASKLKSYKGLGLVDFVVFPHWGSKDFREIYLNERLRNSYNQKNKIILLTDYQYVRVKDDWYRIVDVK